MPASVTPDSTTALILPCGASSLKHSTDVAAQSATFDIVRGATTKFWKEQLILRQDEQDLSDKSRMG